MAVSLTAITSCSYPSLPRAATSQPGFLLPYLQYGPNNQFLQLMEAAVAAKALGRALLVPSFRAWVQDETSSAGSLIRFEDTWDVDALSHYVQLAHPPSRTSTLTGHTLVALADYKQKATEDYLRVQRLPCCPKKKRVKGTQVGSSEQVRRLARDAGIGPQQPLIGWYSFFTTARPQLVEAARHFRRAAPIRTQAERLAEVLFGGEPFLAVHLRREVTDLGCTLGHPTVLCPKNGAQWTIETPQVLREIAAVQQRSGLRHVYIATIHPPMVAKYAHELDTLLHGVAGAQSASDQRRMADALGMGGGALTRWQQSLIEQQLCATAHTFIGSDLSTWTGNVALEREASLGSGARSHFFGAVGSGRSVELRQ